MQTTQQGRYVDKAAQVTRSQEAGECQGTGTLRWGEHWRSELGGVAYVLHSGTTGKKLVTVQHLNAFPLQHFQQFKSSDISGG